jgi:hypothetical protein
MNDKLRSLKRRFATWLYFDVIIENRYSTDLLDLRPILCRLVRHLGQVAPLS